MAEVTTPAATSESLSELVAELESLKVSDLEAKAVELAKTGVYTFVASFALSAQSIPLSVAHLGDAKAAIASAAIAAAHVTLKALEPAAKASIHSLHATAKSHVAASKAKRQAKRVAKAKAIIAAAAVKS